MNPIVQITLIVCTCITICEVTENIGKRIEKIYREERKEEKENNDIRD